MKFTRDIFLRIGPVAIGLLLVAVGLRQINIWSDVAALFSRARLPYQFELGVAMVVAGLVATMLFILEFRPRAAYARTRSRTRRLVR